MIIKHWRQDWIYENTEFYIYDHDNKWSFLKLPNDNVKGQWTQKVFQVDDSPRYEGSGSWVYVDGKKYWESTTDAPLPRREYTTRSDYNLTDIYSRNEDLELENKFEGKKLYSVLFSMDVKSSDKKIKKSIMPYIKSKS